MKRARGTGTLEQLPNGDVRGRIRLKGRAPIVVTGKAHMEGGRLVSAEDDARALLIAAREMAVAGDAVIPIDSDSVEAMLQALLDRKEAKGTRGMSAIEDRAAYLRKAPWISWHPSRVKITHVDDWIAEVSKTVVRRGRKLKVISPTTVSSILGLSREVFNQAIRKELIQRNPAEYVEPPAQEDPDWKYYTPEQQRVLQHSQEIDESDRLVALFAMGSGAREGETAHLHLADIKPYDPEPHFFVHWGSRETRKEAKKRGASVRQLRTPKSRHKRRVPLFGVALEAARRWLELLPSWCPPEKNRHGLVFPRQGGGYRDSNHMLGREWVRTEEGEDVSEDRWKLLQLRMGLTPIRWHDLRHTCATSLGAGWWGEQWSLDQIAHVLGHLSTATTRRYRHLIDTALNGIARRTPGLPPVAPLSMELSRTITASENAVIQVVSALPEKRMFSGSISESLDCWGHEPSRTGPAHGATGNVVRGNSSTMPQAADGLTRGAGHLT